MADEREKGWEPWEPAQDRGGSGVGAFRGHKPPPGAGEHGIGAPPAGETIRDLGEGPTRPEFPPEGWGEEGENYPPTRGPVATLE